MMDVASDLAAVATMVLFFPVVNGLAVLLWYNVIVMWRERELDNTVPLVLGVILAYVVTLVSVLFDVVLVSLIVNLVSMLT